MIRYTIKLALRLALLVAALFALGFLTAHVANADDRTDPCNPLTYGRPNSCHTAPVVRTAATAEPLVLDTSHGFGHAAVAGWSRGYRHVMLYAEYQGRATVRFSIDCPGLHYSNSWTDSGPHFRFVHSVPGFGRCEYRGVLRTNNYARVYLGLGVYG